MTELEDAPAASSAPPRAWVTVLVAAAFGSLVSALTYMWFGDTNINVSDEGYLWYGVLRVLEGEVPFRDFQAYDPGRYAWCAWLSPIFGSGILGVRASVAVFQAVGLTFGLLVARRLVSHDAWLFLPAVILSGWMFPRHKAFEPALALIVCWFVVRLVERPSLARHVACGVCIGLVGWFGRNHALYSGVATALTLGYLAWKRPVPAGWRRFFALCGGVVLGYSPILFRLAFTPGFASAFKTAVLEVSTKGANLPRAYPWPWLQDFSEYSGLGYVAMVLTNVAFMLPFVVLPLAFVRLARADKQTVDRRPVLVACTFVALIYLHHAAIRSDESHLAQCIHPLLLTTIALGATMKRRAVLWGGVTVLSYFAVLNSHTAFRWHSPWGRAPEFLEYELAGEKMRMIPARVAYLEAMRIDVAERIKDDEIFIAPFRPTLYPILGKRAPVPQIYLLWKAPEEEQREIIRALETQDVKWALLMNMAPDGRQDLRFVNTHPLVYEYIYREFRVVKPRTPFFPSDHILLRRKKR